jgi:hypothetical protein
MLGGLGMPGGLYGRGHRALHQNWLNDGSRDGCRRAKALCQCLELLRTFFSRLFYGGEHGPGGIDSLKNQRNQRRGQFALTLTQLAEQTFGLVRDLFKRGKTEKTASTLNSVYGSEDARQKRRVRGVLFQFDEFPIQTGEVFMALNEELANYILVLHSMVSMKSVKIETCKDSNLKRLLQPVMA